ncbi:MAG: amidohydrolase family protein [Porticoccaceae bacterium]|nr:amidohydrolase family protein [Porticoccaceae bacterium]
MATYDTIIKNGTIFDGTRIPRFKGDIGIKGGNIAKIGRLDAAEGDKIIDAEGKHVCPGFIDLHTHYDAQLFWDPYCSLSSWHGITSVVIGNCGFGFAPVAPDMQERSMLSMTRIEAIPYDSMKEGMPWDWETFPEYLDSIDRTPLAINILPYVPLVPMLITVLGFDRAKAGAMPTPEEEAQLCAMLEESMDAGGCGWSAQRLAPGCGADAQRDFDGSPMPTDVMHDETAIALAKVLAKRNEGFMQVTMLSGNDPVKDRAHMEELSEISGRPLLYNVVQSVAGDPSVHRETLQWLKEVHGRGNKVYGQGLTTDCGFTFAMDEWNLWDDSEAWRNVTTGTFEERLAKMADPANREALRNTPPGHSITGPIEEVVMVRPNSDNFTEFTDHKLSLIAEKTGKHPVDCLLDIAVGTNLKAEFYAMLANGGDVDNMREIIQDPFVTFGVSDGGAHTRFLTAGRYPTEAISRYVREHEMLSLEDVHWRLSALPAAMAGFKTRGTLVEGAPADIVVYDYENLEILDGEIVHDMPGNEWRRVQRAKGYNYILVNGEVTIDHDEETHKYSGRLLRHGA